MESEIGGFDQQPFIIRTVWLAGGNPDDDGDMRRHRGITMRQGACGDCFAHYFGHAHRAVVVGGWQDRCKFLATVACNEVGRSLQYPGQDLRHFPQALVSLHMANCRCKA